MRPPYCLHLLRVRSLLTVQCRHLMNRTLFCAMFEFYMVPGAFLPAPWVFKKVTTEFREKISRVVLASFQCIPFRQSKLVRLYANKGHHHFWNLIRSRFTSTCWSKGSTPPMCLLQTFMEFRTSTSVYFFYSVIPLSSS